MGLASELEISEKPREKKSWTMRRLLPMKPDFKAFAKIFVNPLEVALGFNIFIFGISILIGRPIPTGFYFLTFPFIIAVAYERLFLQDCSKCEVKEKIKKSV